ncbi:flagellar assembly peptidoglycan hydrolase FlgJ [Pseudoduganella sp. GCM10020061]|uniref:flagellar assembly peptidoglycan hydrolase FlgJ n=1 Tax=Pseudoduganella sp. GCM10020061 TaxID=3317345 RepID=UPI00362BA9F6
MIDRNDLTGKLALDTKGLGQLRQAAKNNSPEALKGAATQFEAMFINMMMKSMRDATPQDGMMDNQQTKMFTTMLDQQLSQNMAKRGMGLADMLVRQLSPVTQGQALAIGGEGGASAPGNAMAALQAYGPGAHAGKAARASGAGAFAAMAPVETGRSASGRPQAPHVKRFQDKLEAHAQEASRATGIPAKFMIGQAALESGWGKREIRNADGTSSHNLFGIKAGKGWTGKTTDVVTTEYVNGVAQRKVEKFRAYDSYADSFKDYARLLSNNPRYEKVMASAGDAASFAHGLQRAGYATDPAYGAKLERIIRHSLAG